MLAPTHYQKLIVKLHKKNIIQFRCGGTPKNKYSLLNPTAAACAKCFLKFRQALNTAHQQTNQNSDPIAAMGRLAVPPESKKNGTSGRIVVCTESPVHLQKRNRHIYIYIQPVSILAQVPIEVLVVTVRKPTLRV